jgi:hypothetical protein
MWHSCWKGTFGETNLPCKTTDYNKIYLRFDEPQTFNNIVLIKRNNKQQYDHYQYVCVSVMDPAKKGKYTGRLVDDTIRHCSTYKDGRSIDNVVKTSGRKMVYNFKNELGDEKIQDVLIEFNGKVAGIVTEITVNAWYASLNYLFG